MIFSCKNDFFRPKNIFYAKKTFSAQKFSVKDFLKTLVIRNFGRSDVARVVDFFLGNIFS